MISHRSCEQQGHIQIFDGRRMLILV